MNAPGAPRRGRLLAVALLPALITIPALAGIPGDQDGDTDVDVDDIAIILADVNTPAGGPTDPKDLDGDGTITSLDAGKAVLLCNRPLCATGNNPPMAVDDFATVDEGGTVMVLDSTDASVLDNDSDPDMNGLTVTVAPMPTVTNGTLTLAADGTFSYTHDGSETIADSFVYEACDDGMPSMCDTATVSITIDPVDDPPVAVDDTATVDEDDPATAIDVLMNDTDVDAGPISVASVTQPANGTVINNVTDVTYQPAPDDCNDGVPTEEFTYTLTPGGSMATVQVTVNCVNDAPAIGGGPLSGAFTEGMGPATAALGITVTDVDSASLASATVTITNLTDAGEEVLAATPSGAIAGGDISYVAPTLTIAPGGGAAAADFQAVLQSLVYEHTGENPTEMPDRTLSIVLDDGTDASSPEVSTVSVTAVNDAPTIGGGPLVAAFTEDVSGPVAVAAPATLADVDDTMLATVVVTITNLTDAGQEFLAATPSGAIAGGDISYVAPTLTIAPGGGAPLADFQAVLQSVTYDHTGENPTEMPDRSLAIVANDGTDPSAAETSTVTVAATDDAPQLSTPHAAAFTEGMGAVAVAPAITVTDVDSTDLTTATVTLTNPQDGASEQLGATACGGLTVMGAGTGTLNISGAATPAAYQTCLRSVTYNHTSVAPTELPDRSITLVVNDGTSSSNIATSTVSVTAVDSPPMLATDPIAYTTVGNTQLRVASLATTAVAYVADADDIPTKATVTDPDSVGLTYSLFSGPSNGSASVDASGSFLYTPNAGFVGADSFDYQVSDGVNMPTGTVNVTVTDTDGAVGGNQVIWYVENDAAAGGDGTSAAPFDTLADAESANVGAGASGVGDTIFVLAGDGTTANQTAGLELDDNQKLIGHAAATLVANGVTIQTPSPGGRPRIGHTGGGDGVELTDRSGVEIRNLEISGDVHGIDVAASSGTPTLVIDNNVLTGSAGGHGVSIVATGTASPEVDFSNNTVESTNAAFRGVHIDGSGTTGTLNVTGFAANSVNDTAGVVGTGIRVAGATFDSDTGTAGIQQVAAGTLAIGTSAADRTQSAGLELNTVRGDLAFSSVTVFNSGGTGIELDNSTLMAADFSLTIHGGSVDTAGGTALDLDPATVAVTLASVTTSGTFANQAVNLADLTGTVNIQGGSLAGASGATFNVDGGSANVTYSGTITNTAGSMINVQSTTGGTVLFDGASLSDSGAGGDSGLGIIITNTAGDVTIDATTTTLNQSDASGINILGAVTGTVRVDDATITSPTALAVNINGDSGGVDQITGTVDLNNVDSSATSAAPIVTIAGLDTGASVDFDSASSIHSSGGGGGVVVTSNAAGTVAFNGPVTLSTGTNDAVSVMNNTSGTTSFLGDLDIDTTTGRGFFAFSSGTVNVDSSSSTTTIDTGAGSENALRLAAAVIGATGITFDTITATGTIAVFPNSFGAIQLTGVSGAGDLNVGSAVIDGAAAGSRGIFITSLSTNATFTSVTIDDTTEAFCLNSNTGNVTVNGGTIGATTTTSGTAIDLGNAGAVTTGNVTISASITNSAGPVLAIDDLTAGTVLFNGAIDEDGDGVVLADNTGATITIRGGITLDTGANTAFSATSGGTVNVCATTLCSGGGSAVVNTVGTAGTPITGVGVDIADTTIGGEGMTFRSIHVTGASNGIALSNSGTGFFTVTGVGASTSAGNRGKVAASDGTGGVIASATGDGVSLSNATNVTLHSMNITSPGADGISAADVSGLNLANVTIDQAATHGVDGARIVGFTMANSEVSSTGNANEENALNFGEVGVQGLTGTASILDSTIDIFAESGMEIRNTSGTLSLTIDNSQFSNNQAGTFGEEGILFSPEGTSIMTVLVEDSDFLNLQTQGIDATVGTGAADTSVMNLTVRNSNFNNYLAADGMVKFDLFSSATSNLTVSDTQFTPVGNGRAIFMKQNLTADLHATIQGNTITGNDTANFGRAVELVHDGPGSGGVTGSSFLLFGGAMPGDGNTITGYELEGLFVDGRETVSNGTVENHLTVLNNNITASTSGAGLPIFGIQIDCRNQNDTISDIVGNTTSGFFFRGIKIVQRDSSSHLLRGMAGSSAANAEARLASANPGENVLASNLGGFGNTSGGTYGGGTPTLPTPTPLP